MSVLGALSFALVSVLCALGSVICPQDMGSGSGLCPLYFGCGSALCALVSMLCALSLYSDSHSEIWALGSAFCFCTLVLSSGLSALGSDSVLWAL